MSAGAPSRLVLRPALPGDAALIERLFADPEARGSYNFFGFTGFRPPGDLPAHAPDGARGRLVVEVDGDACGTTSWHAVQFGPTRASESLEIGMSLLPEARGRGVGARATSELVRYLFAHTRTERIQACTDVTNQAACRVLEHAGFSREGVMRAAQWRDGAFRDLALYAIVRADSAEPGTSG